MIRTLTTTILLGFLAFTQQFDPTGRWVHNGPIGEVILDLRADKTFELKFPGTTDKTGTWQARENHVVLTPATGGNPQVIDIKSIGANQVNIDFRNGMAMDFVRAGAKVVKEPEEETPADSSEAAGGKVSEVKQLWGEWYWESGDDDMTLEVYPDGTYYFDYWIGDDEYDSEGKFELKGDSLILTPEEGEGAPLTLTILELQPGKRVLIRLAYGKEYWLDLEDTIDPDDY